mgnify:CR=1 FL=1
MNCFFNEKNIGRIKAEDYMIDENLTIQSEAGYHHMGGTRMSNSKKYGVVDNNCKVFGSENLYI